MTGSVNTQKIHFISAGAGSGKTFSLTARLTQLLSSGQVAPAGVIATTFTTLAAGELKERVRSALIQAGHLKIANQMEQSLISTVNSVCGDLLRRFAFEAGMPPDQQVLEETQGDILFYQAMERALANNKLLMPANECRLPSTANPRSGSPAELARRSEAHCRCCARQQPVCGSHTTSRQGERR